MRHRPIRRGRVHHGHHAHAQVQGALQVRLRDLPQLPDDPEDRRDPPAAAIHPGLQALRQHARQVRGQPAAGHVAEGPHPGAQPAVLTQHGEGAGQVQHVRGVDPGGLQQLLAEGAAELGDLPVQGPPGHVHDLAHQRVPVGVQPGGGHPDQHVAGPHPVRAEQLVGLHDAGRGPGDVVLLRAQQPRVLGGLPAHQGRVGRGAGRGDPAHDPGDPLRDHLAAGDVVGHVQRLRADHHDVVHDHAHQVPADGVVDLQGLGDCDLGAHPVGGGRQVGLAVAAQRGEVVQPGEAADAADHPGPVRGLHGLFHEVDGAVPGLDVHAGLGVGQAGLGLLGVCHVVSFGSVLPRAGEGVDLIRSSGGGGGQVRGWPCSSTGTAR